MTKLISCCGLITHRQMLEQPGAHHAGRLLGQNTALVSLRAGRAGEVRAQIVVGRVDLRVTAFIGAAAWRHQICGKFTFEHQPFNRHFETLSTLTWIRIGQAKAQLTGAANLRHRRAGQHLRCHQRGSSRRCRRSDGGIGRRGCCMGCEPLMLLMLLMLLVRNVMAGGRAGRLQRMVGAEVLADRHEGGINGRTGIGSTVCVAGIRAGVGGVRGSVVAAKAALRGGVVVMDVVGA